MLVVRNEIWGRKDWGSGITKERGLEGGGGRGMGAGGLGGGDRWGFPGGGEAQR